MLMICIALSLKQASDRRYVCAYREGEEVPTVSSYNSVKILIRECFACRQMAICSLENFPTQELQSRHKLFFSVSCKVHSTEFWAYYMYHHYSKHLCKCVYVCVWACALTEITRGQWVPQSRGYRHFWATWCELWDLTSSLLLEQYALNY